MTPPENYCTCDSGTCGTAPGKKLFVPMVWGYDEEDRFDYDIQFMGFCKKNALKMTGQ